MGVTMPSVLILILNYGTYDLTIKMIQEIYAKLEYDNYTIMVVDNCSPNESAEVLEEQSKKLNFLFYANNQNAGYAAGNNIGIRYAIANDYKYTWILNNDIEIREKNVLKKLVTLFEEEDNIGCAGPKIYNVDGSVCAPYCRRPTVWNMTLGAFENRRFRISRQNKNGEVYRVYGCCMLLRNKAMSEIDCMDERTFLYGEESILSERLINKGYITYYDPSVSITHLGSASMKAASPESIKRQSQEQAKSGELYLKEYRHYPFVARWICQMAWRIRIYLIK